MDKRIVIDGNDGTGKSTLVRTLRLLGFTNLHDRGEMSEATLDDRVGPAPDTTYILLDCDWQVSRERLIAAGKDMAEKWHTDEALQHFSSEFRRIAPRFAATIISTVGSPDSVLMAVLTAIGQKNIRIGMPSGRLIGKGIKQLGYPFGEVPAPRQLHAKDGPLDLFWTRSKTYPQMVALGTLDVAVIGSDALAGNPYAALVEVVERVPQVNADGQTLRVVLAGCAADLPQSSLLRVVTPFPEWAQQVFGVRGIPHTIYSVSGGSEGLIAAGVGDVLFDIVETGETLKRNALRIYEDIGTLDTCVIRRRA